jgi:hypothetical protein
MLRARIVAAVACLLTSGSPAAGQHAERFVVAAAGGWSSPFATSGLLGGAAGGEAVFGSRLGVGGEVGLLVGPDDCGLLNVAADTRLRLSGPRIERRTTPLVLAGYSFLHFFEAAAHAWNLGAGADYRVAARRAIRVEFKDIIRSRRGWGAHYWAARVGLVFR